MIYIHYLQETLRSHSLIFHWPLLQAGMNKTWRVT